MCLGMVLMGTYPGTHTTVSCSEEKERERTEGGSKRERKRKKVWDVCSQKSNKGRVVLILP